MSACAYCNTVTANICRVCDPCIESRTTAERLSQGLPAKVEDAATYERLAILMRALES